MSVQQKYNRQEAGGMGKKDQSFVAGQTNSGAGTKTFNILIENAPYEVKIQPFDFNEEKRFYISVNASPYYVFTWDFEISGWRAIDEEAANLPEVVEEAISQKLMSHYNIVNR